MNKFVLNKQNYLKMDEQEYEHYQQQREAKEWLAEDREQIAAQSKWRILDIEDYRKGNTPYNDSLPR